MDPDDLTGQSIVTKSALNGLVKLVPVST